MDGPDIDTSNWDFHLFQKLKQCFQRTNSGRLNANAILCFVNILIKNVDQVSFDLGSRLFNLVIILAFKQLRTGKSVVQARSANFDAHSAFNLLVMDVIALHTKLFHWLWRQEGSDGRDDRSIESGYNDSVTDFKKSVHQHNIYSCAKTFNYLYFQHCALKTVLFF
jgi:hypothetical protein